MAQIVQIPVSFDFRVSKVSWSQVHAHITGWWKRDDGTVDSEGDDLIAEFTAEDGKHRSVRFPLARLPREQRNGCFETPRDEEYDQTIELICCRFEPQVWLSEGGRFLTEPEFRKLPPRDAWHMREDFLRVQPNDASAVKFLEKWGRWSVAEWVGLEEMLSLQAVVREALTSAPGKWFTGPFATLSLWRRRPEYPFFMLPTDECLDAIRMTVTIDLLHRVQFKTCARHDCGLPFAVRSKHRRKFCSQYCGHLESVRRNRKTS